MISDDLLETSVVAESLEGRIVVSENQRPTIWCSFNSQKRVDHFAFLRIAYWETLTHLGGEVDNPIKLTQNNLPGFGTGADEPWSSIFKVANTT